MKPNKSMKSLLDKHSINLINNLPHNTAYPIWHRTDVVGRTYWGVSSFCGINTQSIPGDCDLSQLEWDGNEVYLDALSDEEVADVLKRAIGIIAYWESELEARFPETGFYILASYDNGNMQIVDEDELPTKSVSLRFWADRDSAPVVYLGDFDDWEQPAIIAHCNFQP